MRCSLVSFAGHISVRQVSLDAFRGLVTVMIYVNYSGGSYYFFNHSFWIGPTVADLCSVPLFFMDHGGRTWPGS